MVSLVLFTLFTCLLRLPLITALKYHIDSSCTHRTGVRPSVNEAIYAAQRTWSRMEGYTEDDDIKHILWRLFGIETPDHPLFLHILSVMRRMGEATEIVNEPSQEDLVTRIFCDDDNRWKKSSVTTKKYYFWQTTSDIWIDMTPQFRSVRGGITNYLFSRSTPPDCTNKDKRAVVTLYNSTDEMYNSMTICEPYSRMSGLTLERLAEDYPDEIPLRDNRAPSPKTVFSMIILYHLLNTAEFKNLIQPLPSVYLDWEPCVIMPERMAARNVQNYAYLAMLALLGDYGLTLHYRPDEDEDESEFDSPEEYDDYQDRGTPTFGYLVRTPYYEPGAPWPPRD
ncbi:hypothetical protein EJ05DRAFT_510383 [Pseudovirgaria hyperparasitica]|uniref:Uncharacterized protein n=1 Tax=Pseudovirgaria hyperparasitica TaxID=470096 RepID=A0A6A6W8C1_9PEZI|nr:uncharacterized protein EJ05DRAFT_510383 [Pseudovirgaria hyperparasitica]KAF2758459.1 hypothetical protein EJ05DRAFT_510383 [Pseudovirgaria hyperparasitica]